VGLSAPGQPDLEEVVGGKDVVAPERLAGRGLAPLVVLKKENAAMRWCRARSALQE